MSATANLNLVYLDVAQAQKEVSINAGWDVLDAIVVRKTGDTLTGGLKITRTAVTTGNPAADLWVVTPADTGMTLSTEAQSALFDFSASRQFATGALTNQRAMRIRKPTYTFVGASTITTAATVSIEGAPVAGTNATITNSWAFLIESGPQGIVGAPVATANYGLISLGSGGFAGGGGSNFAGSSSGTHIAVNAVGGYAGNLFDLQVAGVSKINVDASGDVSTAGTVSATGSMTSGGNMTVSGFFGAQTGHGFAVAQATLTPGADTDYTLSSTEYSCCKITLNTGSWTTAHNVIFPVTAGGLWFFRNTTAFVATCIITGGAGFAVAAGKSAWMTTGGGTTMIRGTADV